MFKMPLVLVGWLMVTCHAKAELNPEFACATGEEEVVANVKGGALSFIQKAVMEKKTFQEEVAEVADDDAGQAMLATKGSTAKHTLSPGRDKHCNVDVVKTACYELNGDSDMSIFTPVMLANAFNADLSSSKALLAFLGLNQRSVTCVEFCHALLDAIPVQSRPPAPQVGPRLTANGTVWDEDLSDAILEGITIADEIPDQAEREMVNKVVVLQQKVDLPHAETKEDVPHDETKEMSFNFSVVPVPDFLLFAAEAFQIYPILNSSSEKKAGLAEQAASWDPLDYMHRAWQGCTDESIWGNGAEYIGCQSVTVKGKPCLAWSSSRRRFSELPSNYCRNPDGKPRLWCFTHGNSWDFCEPKGAPDGFTLVLANVVNLAQSWMSLSLKQFNAYHLPAAYEKWLGPSEVRRKGVTKQGCTCKKSWTYGGKTINDYCGNPDNDAGGAWCFVSNDATGTTCQGANWGYCAKSTDLIYTTRGCACEERWESSGVTVTDYCGNPDNDPNGAWCVVQDQNCQGTNWGTCRSLCGAECQHVRSKLTRTYSWLSKLAVKFDGQKKGVFGYVFAIPLPVDTINVLGREHIFKQFQSPFSQTGVTVFKKITSKEVRGRKEVFLASAWWDKVKDCTSDILKCSSFDRGTAVGTIIHETMHHVGFWDYLYYRNVVQKFKGLNQKSKRAMSLVRNCADCVEYFLADNNGYTQTGR